MVKEILMRKNSHIKKTGHSKGGKESGTASPVKKKLPLRPDWESLVRLHQKRKQNIEEESAVIEKRKKRASARPERKLLTLKQRRTCRRRGGGGGTSLYWGGASFQKKKGLNHASGEKKSESIAEEGVGETLIRIEK